MENLPHALAASTALVGATVLIHLIGLDLLMRLTRLHVSRFLSAWLSVDRLVVPLGIVLGLFVIHGVEIWIYAWAYRLLGVAPDIETALYISASSYSTLGEAGGMLPRAWRVLGALEGVNGMLLIGWSTAMLFRVLTHLIEPEDEHVLPKGAIGARPRRRAN